MWIPPRSRDAFFKGYPNAPIAPVDLDPSALGLPALGHMGYFRRGSESLWAAALAWFDEDSE